MQSNHITRRAAFTLVELAVVVTIIAILAAIAIPHSRKTKDSALISTFEHDIRLFEQELDSFELIKHRYPPTQNVAGAFPVGMENRMSVAWKNPPPIGGTYRWVYTTEDDPKDRSGYIEVVGTLANPILIDAARLIEIDEDLDDGNPSTGHLRQHGLNIQYYVKH
jgi:prepilin-type N-terminal cleavage/methylation domain-containing protein